MVSTTINNINEETNKICFKDRTSVYPVNIEHCTFELFLGEDVIFTQYENFEDLLLSLSQEIKMKTFMRVFLRRLRKNIKHKINN